MNDLIQPRTLQNMKNSLARREVKMWLKRARKPEWPHKPAYQPSVHSLTKVVAQRCGIRYAAPHNEERGNAMQADSVKLRELASWYREQAERAENPAIWEARLRTAEELDDEADRIEGKLVPYPAFGKYFT